MLPLEFDRQILSSLPLPGEDQAKIVLQVLKSILSRRIFPYFKTKRGTDPLLVARVEERLELVRLEDETNRIETVSLVDIGADRCRILIHERIFDYLAFVIPSDPETRLSEGNIEERKMLAFAEFMLRHEIEHMFYRDHRERQVVVSDVDFAMDRRVADPTYYRMLLGALGDEMIGLRGERYLALFGEAEQDRPLESLIIGMLNLLGASLSMLPVALLDEVFNSLDVDIKSRILMECYRRSRDPAASLMQRLSSFQRFARLFSELLENQEREGREVFQVFKDRWGLEALFRELAVPETSLQEQTPERQLVLLRGALKLVTEEGRVVGPAPVVPVTPIPAIDRRPMERPEKSLKDRIEDARSELRIPRQVIGVIDKNILNAIGHSGSKYSELIETLLAIPWGKIQRIEVTSQAFEEGLNRSHYGLQRPKELLSDFFSNLIWRYRRFDDSQSAGWQRNGSAFLLVGPPGVGKTSLAISVAKNLGIPHHKISLGGMRDEADIRGHGFTYEGSKPGAIVQGLIKMGIMNGMFILDEADKTEKFAIATLLEILDPEQNHLFHDKYAETMVDIDLSNCHFFLTANTLETVPPVVINRCEVVLLDRYSVEEKVAIAQKHLIPRLRSKYQIESSDMFFDPVQEEDLLRYLVQAYTYEAGVRELERIIRTLFLRIQRMEILPRSETSPAVIRITREKIKATLKEPARPRQINDDDRVGEMLGLGVDVEVGGGAIIPIQATRIAIGETDVEARRSYMSIVHATGNLEKVMDESRKVATTGILHCAAELGIDLERIDDPVHLHFMGASTRKDGPSAGGAIGLALASLFADRSIRRDVAMTGEIDTKGRITIIGGLAVKLETAANAGCRTVIIPKENLQGEQGIERFPEALRQELQVLTYEEWSGEHEPFEYLRHELQVVAVDHIVQAARIAFVDDAVLQDLEAGFVEHGKNMAELLVRARLQHKPCLQAVLVKSVDELDPCILESLYGDSGQGLTVLITPELRDALAARLAEGGRPIQVRGYDARLESLSVVMREILASRMGERSADAHLSLVAPFYFLKRDGIRSDSFPGNAGYEGIKIFANNYTLQGVKIKNCKGVLNQIYCLLAYLPMDLWQSCPFLARQDGIIVADLSFIPEALRLDVQRAERIFIRCLRKWLETIRDRLREK
ncbi:MAG TPA: ATP-dependent protease [Syntrophobacteraceae bacterium]|nr:ATP-dependent protease [Syntrophobacteraceae bacterium]